MGWSPELDLTTEYGKSRNTNWHPEVIKRTAANFVDFVAKRNEIIINNDIKLNLVVEIFKRYPVTTICFNESVALASKIAETINKTSGQDRNVAIVYHSKVESQPIWDTGLRDYIRYSSGQKAGEPKLFGKDTLRRLALEGLFDGTYKLLSTARALDEGTDVPTIEQVITTAGTANPIQYEQRSGRGKRVDAYNPNKITKIFNIYINDFIGSSGKLIPSRDKQKLINKQKERNSSIIWLENLDEITE
jgi:superfamily II DNA or RNA helicase